MLCPEEQELFKDYVVKSRKGKGFILCNELCHLSHLLSLLPSVRKLITYVYKEDKLNNIFKIWNFLNWQLATGKLHKHSQTDPVLFGFKK